MLTEQQTVADAMTLVYLTEALKSLNLFFLLFLGFISWYSTEFELHMAQRPILFTSPYCIFCLLILKELGLMEHH